MQLMKISEEALTIRMIFRAPKKDLQSKDFLGKNFRAPAKIFAKQKDLWEKEEQALKTWCLPSGKYPKRALCDDAVPPIGLEPIRLSAQDPKSCTSANSVTAAYAPSLTGRRAKFSGCLYSMLRPLPSPSEGVSLSAGAGVPSGAA